MKCEEKKDHITADSFSYLRQHFGLKFHSIDKRFVYVIRTQGLFSLNKSFQMMYKVFSEGASKLKEVKDLDIRIYLIKRDFLGSLNFDFWQF